MRWQNIGVVAHREFMSRVKTKGFWLMTIALPVFMAAMIVGPALIMSQTRVEQRLVIADRTQRIAEPLEEELQQREEPVTERMARFRVEVADAGGDPEALRAELDRRVRADEIDAWLWIDDQGLETNRAEYHAENVSNEIAQRVLARSLSSVVQEMRLADAGYDADQVSELTRRVSLGTVRITEEGSREEESEGGLILAFVTFFMLYMVILIYGQQVLQGVLEEKSSRTVEVMLSSVRPAELMGGKLLGVCGASLAQLAIWMGTAVVLTTPAILTSMSVTPAGFLPQISPALLVHFFAHFLMGFFIFSSFYAMLGAAFNDLQEAQQLAFLAIIPLVLPMLLFGPVINDPNSAVAVVGSLIPPMTPVMMMMRIAIQTPPWWQLALGYLLGFGFTAFMVWAASRVYRVGILMYGKKPTIPEIWRWARYSGR